MQDTGEHVPNLYVAQKTFKICIDRVFNRQRQYICCVKIMVIWGEINCWHVLIGYVFSLIINWKIFGVPMSYCDYSPWWRLHYSALAMFVICRDFGLVPETRPEKQQHRIQLHVFGSSDCLGWGHIATLLVDIRTTDTTRAFASGLITDLMLCMSVLAATTLIPTSTTGWYSTGLRTLFGTFFSIIYFARYLY